MRLHCVIGLTKEDQIRLDAEIQAMLDRLGVKSLREVAKFFENYKVAPGYSLKKCSGKIKEGIEISEVELSYVCDDGYSYFGGDSVIHPDRTFEVTIYTD